MKIIKTLKVPLIRWTLFILIGLPTHWMIFMPIYVVAFVIWFFIGRFKEQKIKSDHQEPVHWELWPKRQLLKNNDNHNMLTQWTIATTETFLYFAVKNKDGLWDITRIPVIENELPVIEKTFDSVSGDCLVSWTFAAAYQRHVMYDREFKQAALEVAKTYLLYLGCRSFDRINNGMVSARCNNFGLNWCPDGWMQIGQPCFGPQYFTSASIFAIASQYSLFWKAVYFLHWLLLGGWVFQWMPLVVPKNSLFYVRDITAKAIYVHKSVFGKKRWIKWCFNLIHKSFEYKNPLLSALVKDKKYPYGLLPEKCSRFFTQNKYGLSQKEDDCVVLARYSIMNLYKEGG